MDNKRHPLFMTRDVLRALKQLQPQWRTPVQAMRDWHDQKPEFFNNKPVASTA